MSLPCGAGAREQAFPRCADPGMTMAQYYTAHAPITYADAVATLQFYDPGRQEFEPNQVLTQLAKMRKDYAHFQLSEECKS